MQGPTSILGLDETSSLQFHTPKANFKKRPQLSRGNSYNSTSTIDTDSASSYGASPVELYLKHVGENLADVTSFDIENMAPKSTILRSKPQSLRKEAKSSILTDRYIPSRKVSKLSIALTTSHENEEQLKEIRENPPMEDDPNFSLKCLYRSLVLGYEPNKDSNKEHEFANNNIFKYRNENQPMHSSQKLTQKPLADCEKVLSMYQNSTRKVSKTPFKVLDAPALQDDYYLNLLDWSSQNLLAVGLSSCVYLWSSQTSRVSKLCDFGAEDSVTSIGWAPRGDQLCVGKNNGDIQLWDPIKLKRVQTLSGHGARVGSIAWGTSLLASGSRDQSILYRDSRIGSNYIARLSAHTQEVCGLKWSFDNQQLASGGNDNKVYIWSPHSSNPIVKYSEHKAAVKALAWSPHQHGLLATGGGTADKTIRFWNTHLNSQVDCIETDSQVCNLMFSKNYRELVSTHGYSQNQVIIWKYPSMEKVATLSGHSYRVLYLAMSPDGQTIVTGAGDETLRFWNAFPNGKENDTNFKCVSKLMPSRFDIR